MTLLSYDIQSVFD